MIELSRTQDEECGDGTTSVIILGTFSFFRFPSFSSAHTPGRASAGEILAQSLSQLERQIHPVVIISAYNKALQEALAIIQRVSVPIDTSSDDAMLKLIKTSIGTKFVVRWSTLMCQLALQAVRTVAQEADAGAGPVSDNVRAVDVKRYARVEKIPGGEIEDSAVLAGVMLNKDIVHPKMRRRIARPRIVLLDCPLEYKKGESQTNIEMSKEDDYAKISMLEEEQVKSMVDRILEFKPDLVITEKGISGDSLVMEAKRTALMSSTKTMPSTGCTRRTSPRFAAFASRTTTESRARPARRSSTASMTSARRTLAHAAGSSTSRRSAMSGCQAPPRRTR
jgi:T-complex protein 1 subunit gamma